jgi:hypothetical protein
MCHGIKLALGVWTSIQELLEKMPNIGRIEPLARARKTTILAIDSALRLAAEEMCFLQAITPYFLPRSTHCAGGPSPQ